MVPVVYMLCGLPGSGKTTYAKELEKDGVIRLTLDEEMFRAHGREYAGHVEKQDEMKQRLLQRVAVHVKAGESVALDFGFWKKGDREAVKGLVNSIGAEPRLIYFNVPLSELKLRIRGRDMSKNHDIDDDMMDAFALQFEPPQGEGEIVQV